MHDQLLVQEKSHDSGCLPGGRYAQREYRVWSMLSSWSSSVREGPAVASWAWSVANIVRAEVMTGANTIGVAWGRDGQQWCEDEDGHQ